MDRRKGSLLVSVTTRWFNLFCSSKDLVSLESSSYLSEFVLLLVLFIYTILFKFLLSSIVTGWCWFSWGNPKSNRYSSRPSSNVPQSSCMSNLEFPLSSFGDSFISFNFNSESYQSGLPPLSNNLLYPSTLWLSKPAGELVKCYLMFLCSLFGVRAIPNEFSSTCC